MTKTAEGVACVEPVEVDVTSIPTDATAEQLLAAGAAQIRTMRDDATSPTVARNLALAVTALEDAMIRLALGQAQDAARAPADVPADVPAEPQPGTLLIDGQLHKVQVEEAPKPGWENQ